MRFGVCAWIYGDAPLSETLARIAAARYEGAELPGEPDRWPPAEVRRLLARHDLAPLALTASCMFPATPRDLANPDPQIRRQAVQYVVDCLHFAAEIGAPLVQMLPSGETRLHPIAPRRDEWRWSVEGMQAAAREAERLGVRIAVEPLNRYEAYLITRVDEGLAYLADVGSPWVGLTFDAFHGNIEEPDPPGAIRKAGQILWHVHLADSNREGLGRGHLALGGILDALRGIDYEGAVVLEVMPPGPDPFRSIKDERSVGILDSYLAESIAWLNANADRGQR
ncbi:MAG: sugar phosphate isomerase/epimerase family protein [bacterium]